jgi:hypothetical protein
LVLFFKKEPLERGVGEAAARKKAKRFLLKKEAKTFIL